jgi:excisionase family DNA binding protein
MDTDDDLIGTSEVCELRKVHRSTVKRWVDAGKLKPAVVLPGAMLFKRADVLALEDPATPTTAN